ncbi:SH3 domain-containing protein [Leptospira kanakyensis]|uniref:SH3 domain-containing protein n=1 Tax=Leptospira kanakyensis TaxID=2484968 RepID=UPI00223D0764|nr:SH3 domain-containing protein [Leptospira kanakyensis]MCW7471752.1 SH3 domain-containing protein [Leptospira kanakyensis]
MRTILTMLILSILLNCEKKSDENKKLATISYDENTEIFKNPEFWYVNNDEGVFLRSEPNVNSKPLGYLSSDQIVQVIGKNKTMAMVLGKKDHWMLVKRSIDLKPGWTFGSFLSKGKDGIHTKIIKKSKNEFKYGSSAILLYQSIFKEPSSNSKNINFDETWSNLVGIRDILDDLSSEFNVQSNWIKIYDGKKEGYVLSHNLISYNENCIFDNSINLTTNIEDISDKSYINNKDKNLITNDFKFHRYGIFFGYNHVSSNDKIELFFTKLISSCDLNENHGLEKVIDKIELNNIKKNSKFSFQDPNIVTCTNKTSWEEEIAIITSEENLLGRKKYEFKPEKAFRFDTMTEKIIELDPDKIQCYARN